MKKTKTKEGGEEEVSYLCQEKQVTGKGSAVECKK